MPVAKWVKTLRGVGGPQLVEFTAGEAIADGDVLIFSSGTVVKATDGVAAQSIAGVAMGDAELGKPVLVSLASEEDLYEVTGSGTVPAVGSLLEVDVTAGVTTFVTSSAASKAVARLIKVIDATKKTLWIRFVSPLLT